jgi:tetratricopeptide (TPR) repeat protein
MRSHPWFNLPAVLVILLGLVSVPSLGSGWMERSQAESAFSAKQYRLAAVDYALAATHLAWQYDLWERAGQSELAAGDPVRAINRLLRARRLSPLGWAILGDAYRQTGQLEAALSSYQSGLALQPDSAALCQRQAAVYRLQGDWGREAASLEAYLSLQPKDAAGHYRLGLLLALSDPNRALRELMSASSLEADYDSVVQTLRTAINQASLNNDPAQQAILVGRALGLVDEWPLAAQAFQKAITSQPEEAEAWAWLGEAHQHLDTALSRRVELVETLPASVLAGSKGQDGLAELDEALRLNPESVTVRALRGLYWKRHDQPEKALIQFRAAAILDPENPAWSAAIGDSLTQQGDLPAALTAYEQASALAPGQADYWRLLATFCAQYDLQVEEVGLPAALQAVSLGGDQASSQDALGWSYLKLGDTTSAKRALLRAVELDPELALAHLHLAMLYLELRQPELAHAQLLQTIQIAGDDLIGQQARGMLEQYYP